MVSFEEEVGRKNTIRNPDVDFKKDPTKSLWVKLSCYPVNRLRIRLTAIFQAWNE